MKRPIIAIIICLLTTLSVTGQSRKTNTLYDSLRYYNFSHLWHADSVLNLEFLDGAVSSEPRKFRFPEPLGYIGNNYQRFYIHFISVQKDKADPYTYNVKGKTRVKDNICSFTGTFHIDSVELNPDSNVGDSFRRATFDISVVLKEDTGCPHSGTITASLETDWVFYKKKPYYDNLYGVADGYCNNQATGQWKSYDGRLTKKCNWGDERMPDSKELDDGAGDVGIDEKYIQYGWQNFCNAYNGGTTEAIRIKALAEEEREWWK